MRARTDTDQSLGISFEPAPPLSGWNQQPEFQRDEQCFDHWVDMASPNRANPGLKQKGMGPFVMERVTGSSPNLSRLS